MMRHVRVFVAILLLVVEVVWLGLQPMPSRRSAPDEQAALPGAAKGKPAASSVQADGMTALVEQEAHMITLRLQGHRAGAEPKLTVTAGNRDLGSYLRFREDRGTETSVRLSYAGVNIFPVRILTYTWEVDGRQVTGQHMYVHPNFPFPWKLEQHGPFTFYHTGTLTEELATQWAALYTTLAGFLGLKPVEQTIYVLPDIEALQKALGSEVTTRKVAGLWIEPLNAVLLSTDFHSSTLQKIVYHELTHAFLANRNPSWWEEGVATWVEGQMFRRDWVWDGDGLYLKRFGALQRVMETEGTFLMRASPGQNPPLDPYTVGFSFTLYLQDRIGEDALLRLAVAASERPVAEALKETLGEDLDQLEVGWQEFVRSGAHLKVLQGQ